MTVPDALAVARLLIVPVVVALTVADGGTESNLVVAGILFAVAAATDFFDGYLARRWKQESVLGAFLDTTADKLLVTGALLGLVTIDRVSVWAALIIIFREIAVMGLRGIVAVTGGLVRPSMWGKIKAAAQFLAIFLAFLRLGADRPVVPGRVGDAGGDHRHGRLLLGLPGRLLGGRAVVPVADQGVTR
jgi:CDP-diacylglycerol--glycerol-3-phosphate 3-phosphatidyltransferase